MYPHLVESEGPKLRLSNVMLENDDMINDDLNYYLPPKSIEYLAKNVKQPLPMTLPLGLPSQVIIR